MLLQLDDKFRVVVDSSKQNFILEKLDDILDKKTKEVVRQDWILCGYHGNSLRSVLLQYRNVSLISDDKLETINDVFDRLNEIERTIEKVVKSENIKLAANND
jgi:tetrahydromethanopterin S-methyltransferase subunit G